MIQMKCSFCGKQIPKGTGKIISSKSGDLLFICSPKCEKNIRMGRKPQKTPWTEKYMKEKTEGKVKEEKKTEKVKKIEKKPTRTRIPKKERRELRRKKKEEKKSAKKAKKPEKKEE